MRSGCLWAVSLRDVKMDEGRTEGFLRFRLRNGLLRFAVLYVSVLLAIEKEKHPPVARIRHRQHIQLRQGEYLDPDPWSIPHFAKT